MSILKPVLILAILSSAMICNNAWATDPPQRVGSVREQPKSTPQPGQANQLKADPDADPDDDRDLVPQGKASPNNDPAAGAKEGAKPDPKADPKKTAQTTPKKPIRRRSTYQMIDPMPRIQAPMVYGPVLTPRPSVGVQPIPNPAAGNPVILNGCNGGACTDPSGARYTGGVGSVLISPEGRACSNNGITVQCF